MLLVLVLFSWGLSVVTLSMEDEERKGAMIKDREC